MQVQAHSFPCHRAKHSTQWLPLLPFILKKMNSHPSRHPDWQQLKELRSRRPLENDMEGERTFFRSLAVIFECLSESLGGLLNMVQVSSQAHRIRISHWGQGLCSGAYSLGESIPVWVCEPLSQTCSFCLLVHLISSSHSHFSLGHDFLTVKLTF